MSTRLRRFSFASLVSGCAPRGSSFQHPTESYDLSVRRAVAHRRERTPWSTLKWLGQGASGESPGSIKSEGAKLAFLRQLGAHEWDLSDWNPNRRKFLAQVGRRSTSQTLQRMPDRVKQDHEDGITPDKGNPTSVEDFQAFEQVTEAHPGENKEAQWWLFGILFASVSGILSQLIGPLPGIHFLASLICMAVPLGEYVYLRNQIPPEVTVFLRMQSLTPLWVLAAASLLNLGHCRHTGRAVRIYPPSSPREKKI